MSSIISLVELQHRCKRDPEAYTEELNNQYRHFQSEMNIYKQIKPGNDSIHFRNIIKFLCQVSSCYTTELKEFPNELIGLLRDHAATLDPDTRKATIGGLMIMRRRNLIEIMPVLDILFEMFRIQDKKLKPIVFGNVVNEIREANKKGTNNKLNKQLQVFMHEKLSDDDAAVAKYALNTMTDLYRRRIWTDARCVNFIADACLSKNVKLAVHAAYFFLGVERKMVDDDDEAYAAATASNRGDGRKMEASMLHSKKTRKRLKQIEKQNRNKRVVRKDYKLFPAIQILHDPQTFCEKLYGSIKSTSFRFEARIVLLDLLSRAMGTHQVVVEGFYTFIRRYLRPHQDNITKLLACFIQGCHNQVIPEDLHGVVLDIANNFISDRSNLDMIQVGMNSIREIITRSPHLLAEEELMKPLITDLIEYRKFKDKGIMMATRGLLQLVRDLNPFLLPKKDRGKDFDKSIKPVQFGEIQATTVEELTAALKNDEDDDEENEEKVYAEDEGKFEKSDDEDEWSEVEDDESEPAFKRRAIIQDAAIDADELDGFSRKKQLTKEGRILDLKSKKEAFDFKVKGGGTTNNEKKRKKNFQMVRKSDKVMAKLQTTLKGKQRKIKDHLKTVQMMQKKLGKRRR